MRHYEHLFFDFDNTLWDFDSNSKTAMHQTLEQTGILPQLKSFEDFFKYYEKVNKSLWKAYHSKRITKGHLIVERFAKSLGKFDLSYGNFSDLNEAYLNNMALQSILFPNTTETLAVLKSRGYNLHIITNGFREVQVRKLEASNLSAFFDHIFISEEIQSAKPHREVFDYALKSSNAKKAKSIMIGDSWDTDIIGAMNAKIDQVMFLNQGKNVVPKSILPKKNTPIPFFLESKFNTKTHFINKIEDLLLIF